jgi:cystathionine beta-lyase
MQKINFDKPIQRKNSLSIKFDGTKTYFGSDELMPMWVADMDFEVPACITEALQKQINHAVFGYSYYPDSLYESIINWFSRRHQWQIEREWILMVPGVVPSLFATILATTKPNDGVIVQSPVYFPFFSAVTHNKRKVLNNTLINNNGYYQIDFDQLEEQAKSAKLLMLCTPHNPVGRVWKKEELLRILEIAERHNLIILSDDIHCDLVYSSHKHTILQTLANNKFSIITAIAPSKTFNIPGLALSALIIPDNNIRMAIKAEFEKLHIESQNPLSIIAFEAAYRSGDEWLNQLLVYLEGNCDYATEFIREHIPQIKVQKPEATYLLWLDCHNLKMSDAELRRFFIEDCKLALNPGAMFGEGGSGFMRLNIGTRRENIIQALQQLKNGIKNNINY